MKAEIVASVRKMGACPEAVAWLAEQKNPAQAWRGCERGDWMLWLVGKLAGPVGDPRRKKLVLAACGCARLSLKYVKAGEERPRIAIETAERWAKGKATIEEVRAAAYAAADAAYAAYAAYAAADAAYAAYAAAYAADVAAYAADAAAYAAERAKALKQCASIVRKFYPRLPRLEA